jgi:hypothetical protein
MTALHIGLSHSLCKKYINDSDEMQGWIEIDLAEQASGSRKCSRREMSKTIVALPDSMGACAQCMAAFPLFRNTFSGDHRAWN